MALGPNGGQDTQQSVGGVQHAVRISLSNDKIQGVVVGR